MPFRYYKSGAMLWAGGVLLPNPNLDLKTTHPTMQVASCFNAVELSLNSHFALVFQLFSFHFFIYLLVLM